ncbi:MULTISPECIES: hypothetical protein [Microbacterium]|uniref:Uncharacterized protein n=1 Tax=Microbacterium wangchenii TaxID=2541726 RepID=A0ABX5SP69_9MICO|nr:MULTISPECIES: hypothetical protein [Microbacterium]MCK6066604.1 hypothetical protein [Microbacterium sp. EYE_512]QBR87938.1 hypothetical protein E4K62_04055 [Microbacterium wangchenii]TFV83939.1 hypothetical protein E4V99_02330 [Microbacterium sp. dk485]TXK18272.1 hypothetical protein FVP99_06745 [Microbacterium wangchenii]
MPRSPLRIVSAAAAFLVCMGLGATSVAAAAPEDPAADSGVIEIPYGEPVDVRPSAGWTVDCAGVGTLDDVDVACTDEGVTLSAPYDPDHPEQVLVVPLRAGDAAAQVRYRVRLAPPAAPEIAASAIDVPLPVGRQSLIPLTLLELTCVLCADARVEIGEVLPATALVGVGPAHLAVRPGEPGPISVKLTVTDDAGQSVDAELTLSAVAATDGGPVAVHANGPELRPLAELVAGDDITVSCLALSPRLSCGADGELTLTEESDAAVQAAFRVIDADGRQALGSITVGPDLPAAPVAPLWTDAADLGIVVPAPPEEESTAPSLLTPLARILQEVPAS